MEQFQLISHQVQVNDDLKLNMFMSRRSAG